MGEIAVMSFLPILWFIITLAGFQSHWLDDVGSGSRSSDAAGIAVSALGSILLLLGWWHYTRRRRRGVLTVAYLFVALISVADFVGLHVDGSLAPSMLQHWRDGLGTGLTTTVALTLAAAIAGLVVVWRRADRRR
jgi:hypothetical protein